MSIKRAIIFDMDGTIVDNMAYHTASWLEFFKRRGQLIDKEEFFLRTAGRQGHEIMREFVRADLSDAENNLLNAEKEAAYRALYAPHRKPAAGFDTLVADAKSKGVVLAVATAAPLENIAFTLDGLDIRRHFEAVIGAADVPLGKPEPDVFLKAAQQCGVAPEHCIVFEDAPLGVEAARRAGMRAVALTTTMPAEAFAAFDNVIAIASDFTSFTIESLFALSAQPT
jgi:beta-phosphoglucomutase family hydrolase